MAKPGPVYIEAGRTWTFASAVDWPGWARRGKGEDGALEALDSYRARYAKAVGRRIPAGPFAVIGRVPGGSGPDFGVPSVAGDWDKGTAKSAERSRLADLLEACWTYFDAVVAGAPPNLRKGPRGGGRDRDAIVEHVREAERGYGPRLGIKIPIRTPWPDQRRMILDAWGSYDPEAKWPLRYSCRRLAWHVLDHAWEIEDKSDP
jgi:hypothetical protein